MGEKITEDVTITVESNEKKEAKAAEPKTIEMLSAEFSQLRDLVTRALGTKAEEKKPEETEETETEKTLKCILERLEKLEKAKKKPEEKPKEKEEEVEEKPTKKEDEGEITVEKVAEKVIQKMLIGAKVEKRGIVHTEEPREIKTPLDFTHEELFKGDMTSLLKKVGIEPIEV